MKWVSCFCFRPFWSIHPSPLGPSVSTCWPSDLPSDSKAPFIIKGWNKTCQVNSPGTANHGTIETMVNHGREWQSMVNHGKWWRTHQRSTIVKFDSPWFTGAWPTPLGSLFPIYGWLTNQFTMICHDDSGWFTTFLSPLCHDSPACESWPLNSMVKSWLSSWVAAALQKKGRNMAIWKMESHPFI